MFNLSPAAQTRLSSVHPDMQNVVKAAAADGSIVFTVAQGLRTREEEWALYISSRNPPYEMHGCENGKPWKCNTNGTPVGETNPEGYAGTGVSNHQSGHAVDLAVIVDGEAVWDLPSYRKLADLMLATAAKLNIPIIWGGTFSTPDNDHFELNRNFYPTTKEN